MALTPEQAIACWNKHQDVRALIAFVQAEVRKDDEALIRQMLEALKQSNATLWEEDDDPARPAHAAITAARARLESAP